MATLTTSYQQIASKYIGTVSGSGVAAKDIYLRVYAKYNSQDIAANKSTVSYKSTLYSEGSGTYFYTGETTTKSLSGTGATTTSATAVGNYYLGETTLSEISGTVTHSAEGAASVTVSAAWNSVPWGVSGSVSGSATLPTIARATTPTLSATSVTMGSGVTITLKPANSTFKHKLRYDFVNVKGSADGMSIGADFSAAGNTTATFTPPTSLGSQIPNVNSGSCTITCYTYLSNGTHIGTKTVSLTVSVPSYTPSISSIALTGNNLLSSTYVQDKSTVTATITASTSYGASITAYSSTVDGKTYSGSSFTSSVLSTGSKSVVTTITDSRGKTGTLTSSAFTVYAYANPSITGFTLVRDSTTPTTVTATVTGSIASINSKNAKTVKVTLNGVTNTITASSYTISGTTTFTGVSTDSSFTGVATLTDSYTSTSKSVVLPTVAVTLDFYKDGKGVAFGKVAETTDLLDIGWSERIRKNLTVNGTATVDGHMYSKYNLYVTGHLYMGGEKSQSGEKFIRFSNPDASTNPHNVCIYGGDASNSTALGIYDSRKSKNLFTYKDTNDTINIGTGASTLNINGNNVADYVVDQGSSGIWDYRKWNSGYAESWGNLSITPTTGNATNSYTVTLPFAFISDSSNTFKVQITPAKTALYIGSYGDCNSSNNLTHTTTTFVMSYKYTNATPYNVSFNLSVQGKWK